MSLAELEARNAAVESMVSDLQNAYQQGKITREQLALQKSIIFGGGASTATPQPVTVTFDASGIEKAMGKSTLYTTRPWARTRDENQATFASLQAEAQAPGVLEHLRAEVLEKAKTNSLSPMEVMALQYLLFYNDTFDEPRMMLAVILLRTPLHSRFLMHNWGAIAPQMYQSDVDQHGYLMEKLNYPLFPPGICRLINEKVFAANFCLLHGGGSVEEEEARSMYRRENEGSPLIHGGGPQQGHEAPHLTRLIQDAVRREFTKTAPPAYERHQPVNGKQANKGKGNGQGTWQSNEGNEGAKN